MKACEVMTTAVLSDGPETTTREAARILRDRGISAVPNAENAGDPRSPRAGRCDSARIPSLGPFIDRRRAGGAARLKIHFKLCWVGKAAVFWRGSRGDGRRLGREGNAAALLLGAARGDRHGLGCAGAGNRCGKRDQV
jgi:CBS domain-containing protein